MGLSRSLNGYYGHVFWDADVWMMPALLALNPSLARSMLDYRYEGLDAARKRAAARGFRGALFPWEAAERGSDDTPGLSMGGEFQHHISADVGLAAWNYFLVTRDLQWLRERGYPLLQQTADFWTSRVARHAAGHYDIEGVTGADEYAEQVSNDAYTNAAAQENLQAAAKAASLLGIEPNPDWQTVRSNIPVLTFPNGVLREHSSYEDQKIKQADAVLLAYPLSTLTDSSEILRNIEFYDAKTDHAYGPAMTRSIYATLYARLGRQDKAYELFKEGYQPLQRAPFGALAECNKCENPYLVTGAGGLLQAVIYGFAGLRITDRGLMQEPSILPTQWQTLTITGVGPERRTITVGQRRQP
jgi:trehalose/maltose hydrolase-like predicted phosphorylase